MLLCLLYKKMFQAFVNKWFTFIMTGTPEFLGKMKSKLNSLPILSWFI